MEITLRKIDEDRNLGFIAYELYIGTVCTGTLCLTLVEVEAIAEALRRGGIEVTLEGQP